MRKKYKEIELMVFYHGTNMIIGKIDLEKSRNRTDFGKGFYLSEKIGTAQGWATSRTELRGGTPTILSYEINDDVFKLYGKRFEPFPTLEWLEFISLNRQQSSSIKSDKKEPRHDYHWASGSIANDRIADVVDEYLAGDITADEAINRARVLPQTYQLSLHTPNAISLINEDNVVYRQFKNGRWSKKWIKRK